MAARMPGGRFTAQEPHRLSRILKAKAAQEAKYGLERTCDIGRTPGQPPKGCSLAGSLGPRACELGRPPADPGDSGEPDCCSGPGDGAPLQTAGITATH